MLVCSNHTDGMTFTFTLGRWRYWMPGKKFNFRLDQNIIYHV